MQPSRSRSRSHSNDFAVPLSSRRRHGRTTDTGQHVRQRRIARRTVWSPSAPTYVYGDDDHSNHTLLVSFAKLHGAQLIADGLIGADERTGLVDELATHLADPAAITFLQAARPGMASAAMTNSRTS